ncbi:MAG: SRPBCC family protein [Nitrososphaerota archaeon]
MPTAQKTVSLKIQAQKLWSFLIDARNIGESLGVVEKTSLAEGRVVWALKAPFSSITQTKTLEVSIDKIEEGRRMGWRAEGAHLMIQGACSLEPRGEETICEVTLTFEPKGALAPILRPMIEMNIGSRLEVFIKSLKERLEGSSS